MLIRHDEDGKMYLYDVVNIKKKRAHRLAIKNNLYTYGYKPISSSHRIKTANKKVNNNMKTVFLFEYSLQIGKRTGLLLVSRAEQLVDRLRNQQQ